jgi:hypothetical protein
MGASMSFHRRSGLTFEGEIIVNAANTSSPLKPNLMTIENAGISLFRIWASRILTAVSALFFLMDGGLKLFKPPFVIEATARLGFPDSTIVGIGVILLVCTVLYLIPRTAVLGTILLTAYLGGAVASNVRIDTPFFNINFPRLFGVMAWASLALRHKRLESILFWAE